MSEKHFQKSPVRALIAFFCGSLCLPLQVKSADLEHIQFEVFAGNENLSSPWVKDLFQDKRGFIWIATNNNLVRFDSQRFKVFAPNPEKAGSITSSKPISIQADADDNIWISSPESLSRFDDATETFENFTLKAANGRNLLQSSQALILSSQKQLMLGSLNGLFIFDPSKNIWTHQFTNIGGESTRVREIIETNPGEFLLGTSTGIWRFDLDKEQFSRAALIDSDGQDVGKFDIMAIIIDREERLWICTESDRLFCFNSEGRELAITINGVPIDQTNLDSFSSVLQDRDGNVWAAPGQRGLIALPPGSLDFRFIEQSFGNQRLERNIFSSIYEMSDGTLCFGTNDAGAIMLDPKRLPIDFYSADSFSNQLSFQNVRRIANTSKNKIWISGSNGQLQRFNLETSSFESPLADFENSKLLKAISFQSITSDDRENLYILSRRKIVFYDVAANSLEEIEIDWKALGTKKNDYPETLHYDAYGILWLLGGKVYQYNPSTKETTEVASPDLFPDGRFRALSVVELENGNMWIGTRLRGIHLYDRQSKSVTRSFAEREYPTLMNERLIFDLSVDERGCVWAATNLGLMMLSPDVSQIDLFQDLPGIGNSSINGLEFDYSGHIWLTSTRGLYSIDPVKRQARHYSQSQGVIQQTFTNKAMTISENGILAIGSLRGLNIIDTLNMPKTSVPATPVVTSLTVPIRREHPHGRNPENLLAQSRSGVPKLVYDNNHLTFQFTSFNYAKDPNTNLRYKIDGLIEDWTSIGQENELTFPSLPPGEFTFRIKAENGDLSSNEAIVEFTISPPFWKTKTFVFISSLALVAVVVIVIRRRTHIISTANKKLETLVTERTLELERSKEEALRARDEAEKANQAKSDFLANISHEIRTPMNGIIGMNHMLVEADLEPKLNLYARTVGHNAESMLALINDILDFSKIEAGKFVLDNEPFNIQTTIEDAINLFTVEAQEKGVDLKFLPDTDLPTLAMGDPLRVKQAIMNLVSNAVKFTSSGCISIYLSLVSENANSTFFECRVKDTGIGIPRKVWPNLFDAFTQADSSTTRKYGGSGLGLSITKNLVEAMNGEIRFESQEGKGTIFTITFKLCKVNPEEVITPIEDSEVKPVGETLIAFPDTEIEEWLEAWLKKYAIPVHIADHPSKIIDALKKGVSNLLVDKKWMDQSVSDEIRASELSTRVIIFQNFTESYKESEQESGIVDSYESYPISPIKIVNLLKQRGQTSGQPESQELDEPSYPKNGPRILIVDDNRMNQEVLKALLSKNGSRVHEATNGREAVTLSSASHYDLIFMDCMMPGMDGYEATRAIRNNPHNPNTETPIIALTANDLKGDRTKCLEVGMDDYLTKPIMPDSLSTILATWISKEAIKG